MPLKVIRRFQVQFAAFSIEGNFVYFYRMFFRVILLCITLLLEGLPAQAGNLKLGADIERLLVQPEDKIDIGIAALTFAKEIYQDLDIGSYSKKIDDLADKVRKLANGTTDPEQRIRALNTVLFRSEGYKYDLSPAARGKKENYFLNGILDTKQGICYTLPLLYMAVAQRLNYPIYPVHVPDHLFLRYANPFFKQQNIEVTSGGKYIADVDYIRDFAIGQKGLASGSYMRTMSYREFMGNLLAANALILGQENGDKALAYLEIVKQRDPQFADTYFNLANGYYLKSKMGDTALAAKSKKLSEQYASKAQELGYVDSVEISKARKLRAK